MNTPETTQRSHTDLVLGFLWLGGVVLIVSAARGDLWFDELWSLSFGVGLPSWTDLLHLRYDNNHVINTLYLRLCGNQEQLIVYRLLSVFCGAASLLVVALMVRSIWGARSAVIALGMAGTSYLLVLYFSEARGYAGAVLCALLAYWLLRRIHERSSVLAVTGFWAACVIGLLFHSTFVMVVAGLALGAMVSLLEGREGREKRAVRLAVAFAGPFAFSVFWYCYFLRSMEIAGGPVSSVGSVVLQGAALAVGLPEAAPGPLVALLVMLASVGAGAWLLRRSGDRLWAVFPGVVFVSPALIVLLTHPLYLHPRYFLVGVPFFYLVFARVIEEAWQTRKLWMQVSTGLALALCLLVQAARNHNLLTVQRGSYRQALAEIWAASGPREIAIASDHDVRNGLLVAFYSPAPEGEKRINYVAAGAPGFDDSEWFIFQSQDLRRPTESSILRTTGVSYSLFREYSFEGCSGWRWMIYRKIP